MSPLDVARVFPLDFDIYTLPYFTWARAIMLVVLLVSAAAISHAMKPWTRSTRTLALVLSRRRNLLPYTEILNTFAKPRMMIDMIFTCLAGGLFGSAIILFPQEAQDMIFNGVTDFHNIAIPQGMIIASMAILAWAALFHLFAGIMPLGLVAGPIDALPYTLHAATWFLIGVLAGPGVLFFHLNPRVIPIGNMLFWVKLFLTFPIIAASKLIFGTRRKSRGFGLPSISDAINRIGGD